jgi:hypothetical protein
MNIRDAAKEIIQIGNMEGGPIDEIDIYNALRIIKTIDDFQEKTLRDYFATEALEGMLAHSRNGHGYRPRDPSQNWHDAISEEAYELADAMLRARLQ